MNLCRRGVRDVAPRICAAALLCAAAGVSAQTGTTAHARKVTVSALDVSHALASSSAISSRPAATIDANEAARRLGQAQLEREQGAPPRPGEQARGTGAGVVNHRYWWRQERLRRVVEQALHRSNETRRSLRARR